MEKTIRAISTLIAALVIAASPAMGASAAAAAAATAADWQEYVYSGDRFAIQFPAEPSMSSASFDTVLATGVTANVYSLEFENILFEATVVELDGLAGRGANFLNEVAYNLQRSGNVIFHDFPRVANRENATFGHTMVVDTEDGRRIPLDLLFREWPLLQSERNRSSGARRSGSGLPLALRSDDTL